MEESIIATKQACRYLAIDKANTLISLVAVNLQLQKPNIIGKEGIGVAELKKEQSVKIMLADTGKATAVADTDEHTVITIISDDQMYEKLKIDS